MSSLLVTVLVGTLLCLVQLAAALPWLLALDPKAVKSILRKPVTWVAALAGCAAGGGVLALALGVVQDPTHLLFWGRLYGALLHAQLTVDFFVLAFPLLLLLWPHGASVALAAFREGVRQPLFWLISGIGVGCLVLFPFLPYFTFGEDFKMVKELGYDITMLGAVIFSTVAASMSISEEIEGRTAITVMSKPVSRRQFLLGKFVGIFLAALLMTGMLGWLFNGVMWFTLWFDGEQVGDPVWLQPARQALRSLGETAPPFILGAGVWFDGVVESLPGLVFGSCQAMVLLAIAVALATRLPMVVNLVTCLVVFFLGHLTHVLVQVSSYQASSNRQLELVSFVARFFENVLPGLEYFDLGAVIVRDVPPDPARFAYYIGSVVLYAILYSVIALLFGLTLFEDRDLA
jgi:hypothetical protein